jgi:hypothetical protein
MSRSRGTRWVTSGEDPSSLQIRMCGECDLKNQRRGRAHTFNHAQLTGVDTAARFDQTGAQVNGRFGQYTASADRRRVQLGLKFNF